MDKDPCMKCYNVRKSLYLETDALGVGMGSVLLHIRDNLICGYDDPSDAVIFWPITFAINRVYCEAVQIYIERSTWCLHGLQTSTTNVFHMKYMSLLTTSHW